MTRPPRGTGTRKMKNPRAIGFFFLFCLFIFLFGCSSNPFVPADDSSATPEGITSVSHANNLFALGLYGELVPLSENVFFSPYSISTAMAVVYEGAEGDTAREIRDVFPFPENDIERRSSYAALYNMFNNSSKDYTLDTANALWADTNFTFLPSFIRTADDYYGAKVTNLDFTNQAEESRKTINSWAEEQTGGRIKDLVPQWTLNSMTRLVITNAIYFKGTWKIRFEKKETTEMEFHKTDYTSVPAEMMHLSGEKANFNYYEDDSLQVLELPYQGDELSMLVFLPKTNGTSTLEENLTLKSLDRWRSLLEERNVEVYLPKFTFETSYFLAGNLASMGMPTPVSMDADFSGIDGRKDLYMTNVIHKAYVAVDEEGTEAAASTAIVMTDTAEMPSTKTIFRADHPFIFIIQDDRTGMILFIGRVKDPNA